MTEFLVYTDGSGTLASEPAGIAFVAIEDVRSVAAAGPPPLERALPLERATNQQAEILAAAYALHTLPQADLVTVRSDSEYVVKGWNEYLPYWLGHNWQKRSGGRAKNISYWQRLVVAANRHKQVRFEWLRGHNGDQWNERADKLAGEARRMALDAVLQAPQV